MCRIGTIRVSLLSLISSLTIASLSLADTPPPATASAPDKDLQEIIVTGTFLPITKQKATTAVSVVTAQEIARLVPNNALDLLSNVPRSEEHTSELQSLV